MKSISVGLAAAAAGALVLLGAAPASAIAAPGASIDPGDSLYAINCDPDLYNDWQLMSVDPATAVSTPIGSGSGEVGVLGACAAQPAYNPVTGTSYYIQSRYDGGTWEDTHLAIIDVTTGVSTTVGEFFLGSDMPIYPRVTALAIDLDGTAYAIATYADERVLARVDLATQSSPSSARASTSGPSRSTR